MKILKLIKLDLKRYMANKTLVFIMIVMPIILAVTTLSLKTMMNNDYFDRFSIGIVNYDNSSDMDMLLNIVKNTNSIKENVDIYDLEYDEAREQLEEDEIMAIVVIPKSFAKNIYYGKKSYIEIYEKEESLDKIQSVIFKRIAYEAIDLGAYAQGNLDLLWDAMGDENYTNSEKSKIYEKNAKALLLNIVGRNRMFNMQNSNSNTIYYFVTFFVLFVFINSLFIFITVSSDEDNNMLTRLKINNYKYSEYIFSKFLVSTLLQIALYGIPLSILVSFYDISIVKILFSVLIIAVCSNELIYLVLNIINSKKIAIGMYISLIVFMMCNMENQILNPISKGIDLILNVINNNALINFSEIILFMVSLFICNYIATKIKKIKGGYTHEKMSKLWARK